MPDTSHDNQLVICMTTTSSLADAQSIAKTLLDLSLAACIQIDGPIQSHYRWDGATHCDDEYRLMIKTVAVSWLRLKECIQKIYPYEEPEIILVPVRDSTSGYRDWVISQTNDGT
ncbi:divalent-cation tolerance protein CutA [Stieleria marina]